MARAGGGGYDPAVGLLDTLERKLRRFGVPNLTLYLVGGQAVIHLAGYGNQVDVGRMTLVPSLVLAGEWWRLVTFVIVPPARGLIFVLLGLYFFYLMGSALESHWGAVRYNLYLLVGYLATVAAAFLVPGAAATNAFLGGSVFLAFAHLYPEFTVQLFFVLPVRIKWLALIAWIGYGLAILFGRWETRLLVLASIGNYLLFFGRDLSWRARTGRRRMERQARSLSGRRDSFHRCAACGITDVSHPRAEFRYCPECGDLGYCMDHIENHAHRAPEADPATPPRRS